MAKQLQHWISRIDAFLRVRKFDRDFDDEWESHFTMLVDEFESHGMPVEEARREARMRLGGKTQLAEAHRALRGLPFLETLLRDLRHGARVLGRNSGFTISASVILALGIGVTASLFTVVSSTVLAPVRVPEPDRVVRLLYTDGTNANFRLEEFHDLRERTDPFADLAAYQDVEVNISADSSVRTDGSGKNPGLLVTGTYWRVLRAVTYLGRTFGAEADQVGSGESVIVLSYPFWQRYFSSDAGVIGRTIYVNSRPFRVIGVTARDVRGIDPATPDFWLPLSAQPVIARPADLFRSPQVRWLKLVARLRSSVSVQQYQAATNALGRGWERNGQDKARVLVESSSVLNSRNQGRVLPIVGLALAAVGFVLLIACTNVSNLLLSRSFSRQREVATRLALGASRFDVIRQLLTESVLLTFVGAAGGLVLAQALTKVIYVEVVRLSRTPPQDLPLGVDVRVLIATLCVSCVCGVLCGLAPALHATSSSISAAMKEQAIVWHNRALGLRITGGFVVAQMSLSVILLVMASLFLCALASSHTADLGFDADSTWMITADLRQSDFTRARGSQFRRDLLSRVLSLPQVESAAFTDVVPATDMYQTEDVTIDSRPGLSAQSSNSVAYDCISASYFQTIRIPFLRGGTFPDDHDKQSYAVVNDAFVRRFLPGADAVGALIRRTSGAPGGAYRITGVVRNSTQGRMGVPDVPMVFYPIDTSDSMLDFTLLVRARKGSKLSALLLSAQVATVDLRLNPTSTSLRNKIRDAMWPTEVGAFLAGLIGMLALTMTASGLFGVTSFAAKARARELGIRVAMGAQRKDVLSLVIGQTFRLYAIGLAVGLVLAAGLARVVKSFLYGLSPLDLRAFGASAVLLLLAALAAGYLPARRAAQADPLRTLRNE